MKKITTILLLTIIVCCLTGCGDEHRLKVDLNTKKEQLESARGEISSLNSKISDLEVENTSLSADLNKANDKIEELEEQLSSKKDDTDSIYSLRAENQRLQDELTKAQMQLANVSQNVQQPIVVSPVTSTQAGRYVSLKFWVDGNTYSSDTEWYSDALCLPENLIKGNVTIISPTIDDEFKLINGYKCYVCFSSTNGLVFAKERPYLKETKAK